MVLVRSDLSTQYQTIQERISSACKQAKRPIEDVHLIAASKSQAAESLRALFALNQKDFGENYLQEALKKQEQLADLAINWHFIGALQGNKCALIAQHFSWVHSVDRLKTAEILSSARGTDLAPLNICIQVNIDHAKNKAGIAPSDLLPFAQSLMKLPNLHVRGLMTLPEPMTDLQAQLEGFQKIQTLLNSLQIAFPAAKFDTLSMGMSDDLELAIEAGATFIRVGTALFGSRISKQ